MRVRDAVAGEHRVAALARHRASRASDPAVVDHRQRDAFEDRVHEPDLRDLDRADLDDRHVRVGVGGRRLGCGSLPSVVVVVGCVRGRRGRRGVVGVSTAASRPRACRPSVIDERGGERGRDHDAERARRTRSIASLRHRTVFRLTQSRALPAPRRRRASTAGRASISRDRAVRVLQPVAGHRAHDALTPFDQTLARRPAEARRPTRPTPARRTRLRATRACGRPRGSGRR